MTLLELLEVLTPIQGKGYKVFANCTATDENLIIKEVGFNISNLKPYYDNKVFQVITTNYENYVDIILEGVVDNA